MSHPRFVGRARQSDPSVFEFGVARRCVRAPRPWDERPRPLRKLPQPRRCRHGLMIPGTNYGGSVRRTMPRAESYLDWNATAPLRPEAAAAMAEALGHWGNPSSVHRRGRAARQIIERAREAVVGLLGDADPSGVISVSGGTEANHLALLGAGRERVLVSAVEHDSVRGAVPSAEIIPVDADGIVVLAALERLLASGPGPALVSVMYANNETG